MNRRQLLAGLVVAPFTGAAADADPFPWKNNGACGPWTLLGAVEGIACYGRVGNAEDREWFYSQRLREGWITAADLRAQGYVSPFR